VSIGKICPRFPDRHHTAISNQEWFFMARETLYLVQAYRAGTGTRLTADAPVRCRSMELARKRAEDLVTTRVGVVAFSTSGDAELGDYDEAPTIIFKAGRLPFSFEEP
jgi:hypothetical protein